MLRKIVAHPNTLNVNEMNVESELILQPNRGNMPRRNPGLLPLYGPLCGAQDLRQTQIDNLHLASTSKKIFSYDFRSYIFS